MEKYLLQQFFEAMGFQVVHEESEQATDPVRAESSSTQALLTQIQLLQSQN